MNEWQTLAAICVGMGIGAPLGALAAHLADQVRHHHGRRA